MNSDPEVPEEERVYTSSKKSWCRKTSKESADRLFELLGIKEIKEDGTIVRIPKKTLQGETPPRDDWKIKYAKGLKLHKTKNKTITVTYEYNPKTGEF